MIIIKLGYQNKAYKMSLKVHRIKFVKKIYFLNSINNKFKILEMKINIYIY
jgi:hypothetical protein